jgi:anthranilate phosphoribosyltransferase
VTSGRPPAAAMKNALIALVDEGRDLTEHEAYQAMSEIMRAGLEGAEGERATPAQFGALVTALRLKGESVDEITGMARAMRAYALRVEVKVQPLLDTAGTGRLAARCSTPPPPARSSPPPRGEGRQARQPRDDLPVRRSRPARGARRGDRARRRSRSRRCIEKTGIGFMFAQSFHPAMKFAGPLRPQIGFRTVFNILGPLTNPAGAKCHVMGAATPSSPSASRTSSHASRCATRSSRAGEDGLDDISVTGPTTIFEVRGDG